MSMSTLQEVLVRLWVDAPTTFGIFRQSPSIKKIREMREGIDGRKYPNYC